MSRVLFLCVEQDAAAVAPLAEAFARAGIAVNTVNGDGTALQLQGPWVIVWSRSSIRSRAFLDSAYQAAAGGRAVLACLIPPPPADSAPAGAFDLSGWTGDPEDQALDPLFFAVEKLWRQSATALPPPSQAPSQMPTRAKGPAALPYGRPRNGIAPQSFPRTQPGPAPPPARDPPRPGPALKPPTADPPRAPAAAAPPPAPATPMLRVPPEAVRGAPPPSPPPDAPTPPPSFDPHGAPSTPPAQREPGAPARPGKTKRTSGGFLISSALASALVIGALALLPRLTAAPDGEATPTGETKAPFGGAGGVAFDPAAGAALDADRQPERALARAATDNETADVQRRAAPSEPMSPPREAASQPLARGASSLSPLPLPLAPAATADVIAGPPLGAEAVGPTAVPALRAGQIVWVHQMNATRLAAAYPPRALAAGIGGRVELVCTVIAAGATRCAVASENPVGQGFGAAALRAAAGIRVAPRLDNGEPAEGQAVRLPVTFETQ